MMTLTSVLFVFLVVGRCLSEDQGPSVVTKSGKILGHYLESYKGNIYEAYQGIPFALPPVGKRRFQSPVPIQPWTEDLLAVKLQNMCPQAVFELQLPRFQVYGSEDCLYLNVYVPTKRQENSTLPVIFYIHGGSYQVGSTKEDEEHYIMDYDVIFVSVQYRLGLLGFLSTEDEVVSGNMALKDQSLALRWVHENIEYFGGDQKKITLLGVSAGASSVHFHYLSPWSKGLFHAGISLSGTAFAPWSLDERSREKTIELGQHLNCTDDDIIHTIECIKEQPLDLLFAAEAKLSAMRYQPAVPFAPVIEKSSDDAFIDDLPSRIINQGKAYDVPWITGCVSEEGLYPVAAFANDHSLKYLNLFWKRMAPILLDYYYTIPQEHHNNISTIIREHYFGDEPISKKNFRVLTNLASDRLFKATAGVAATKLAAVNKSPVFFYHYSYRATDSVSHTVTNSTENLGVSHGDDFGLVLKNPAIIPTKSPNDMAMQRRLIQFWTSVARYGVPKVGIEWPSVNPNSTLLDYLEFAGPNALAMRSTDDFAQRQFWDSIAFDEDKIR